MNAVKTRVRQALARLEREGTKAVRDGMARYGIPQSNAYGVKAADLHAHAKDLGRDQALSEALFGTGQYEARLLAALVGEPALVTSAQMDRWTKTFDSWAVCDTACLHLFDRAPAAWGRVAPWARSPAEFVRRAGFALLAALALHDHAAPDARFLEALSLVEPAANDPRNFVKKGVSWALRAVGQRNATLHAAAIAEAERLAASASAPARWIGKDTLRDLLRPLVRKRIEARARRNASRAAAAAARAEKAARAAGATARRRQSRPG